MRLYADLYALLAEIYPKLLQALAYQRYALALSVLKRARVSKAVQPLWNKLIAPLYGYIKIELRYTTLCFFKSDKNEKNDELRETSARITRLMASLRELSLVMTLLADFFRQRRTDADTLLRLLSSQSPPTEHQHETLFSSALPYSILDDASRAKTPAFRPQMRHSRSNNVDPLISPERVATLSPLDRTVPFPENDSTIVDEAPGPAASSLDGQIHYYSKTALAAALLDSHSRLVQLHRAIAMMLDGHVRIEAFTTTHDRLVVPSPVAPRPLAHGLGQPVLDTPQSATDSRSRMSTPAPSLVLTPNSPALGSEPQLHYDPLSSAVRGPLPGASLPTTPNLASMPRTPQQAVLEGSRFAHSRGSSIDMTVDLRPRTLTSSTSIHGEAEPHQPSQSCVPGEGLLNSPTTTEVESETEESKFGTIADVSLDDRYDFEEEFEQIHANSSDAGSFSSLWSGDESFTTTMSINELGSAVTGSSISHTDSITRSHQAITFHPGTFPLPKSSPPLDSLAAQVLKSSRLVNGVQPLPVSVVEAIPLHVLTSVENLNRARLTAYVGLGGITVSSHKINHQQGIMSAGTENSLSQTGIQGSGQSRPQSAAFLAAAGLPGTKGDSTNSRTSGKSHSTAAPGSSLSTLLPSPNSSKANAASITELVSKSPCLQILLVLSRLLHLRHISLLQRYAELDRLSSTVQSLANEHCLSMPASMSVSEYQLTALTSESSRRVPWMASSIGPSPGTRPVTDSGDGTSDHSNQLLLSNLSPPSNLQPPAAALTGNECRDLPTPRGPLVHSPSTGSAGLSPALSFYGTPIYTHFSNHSPSHLSQYPSYSFQDDVAGTMYYSAELLNRTRTVVLLRRPLMVMLRAVSGIAPISKNSREATLRRNEATLEATIKHQEEVRAMIRASSAFPKVLLDALPSLPSLGGTTLPAVHAPGSGTPTHTSGSAPLTTTSPQLRVTESPGGASSMRSSAIQTPVHTLNISRPSIPRVQPVSFPDPPNISTCNYARCAYLSLALITGIEYYLSQDPLSQQMGMSEEGGPLHGYPAFMNVITLQLGWILSICLSHLGMYRNDFELTTSALYLGKSCAQSIFELLSGAQNSNPLWSQSKFFSVKSAIHSIFPSIRPGSVSHPVDVLSPSTASSLSLSVSWTGTEFMNSKSIDLFDRAALFRDPWSTVHINLLLTCVDHMTRSKAEFYLQEKLRLLNPLDQDLIRELIVPAVQSQRSTDRPMQLMQRYYMVSDAEDNLIDVGTLVADPDIASGPEFQALSVDAEDADREMLVSTTTPGISPFESLEHPDTSPEAVYRFMTIEPRDSLAIDHDRLVSSIRELLPSSIMFCLVRNSKADIGSKSFGLDAVSGDKTAADVEKLRLHHLLMTKIQSQVPVCITRCEQLHPKVDWDVIFSFPVAASEHDRDCAIALITRSSVLSKTLPDSSAAPVDVTARELAWCVPLIVSEVTLGLRTLTGAPSYGMQHSHGHNFPLPHVTTLDTLQAVVYNSFAELPHNSDWKDLYGYADRNEKVLTGSQDQTGSATPVFDTLVLLFEPGVYFVVRSPPSDDLPKHRSEVIKRLTSLGELFRFQGLTDVFRDFSGFNPIHP